MGHTSLFLRFPDFWVLQCFWGMSKEVPHTMPFPSAQQRTCEVLYWSIGQGPVLQNSECDLTLVTGDPEEQQSETKWKKCIMSWNFLFLWIASLISGLNGLDVEFDQPVGEHGFNGVLHKTSITILSFRLQFSPPCWIDKDTFPCYTKVDFVNPESRQSWP